MGFIVLWLISFEFSVMIHWREASGGPNSRIEEVIRALRRMGVNPVAGNFIRIVKNHYSVPSTVKTRNNEPKGTS